jgi:hypothetical protein
LRFPNPTSIFAASSDFQKDFSDQMWTNQRCTYPSPCECPLICSQQFRLPRLQTAPQGAYAQKLSDDEAHSIARNHILSINTAVSHLRLKCATQGKSLSNRWRKKSREKRAAILLKAEASLEEKKWVLPKYLSNNPAFGWEKARERRNAFLLNWLNVESLKNDPARLLGLLNYRTRFAPEKWAAWDNENLIFGYNHGFLAINYSPLCLKMCGDGYGELVPWKREAARRFDIVGFPRAADPESSGDVAQFPMSGS